MRVKSDTKGLGAGVSAREITCVLIVLAVSFLSLSALPAAQLTQCSGPPPAIGNVFTSISANVLQPETITGGSTLVSFYASYNRTTNACGEVQTNPGGTYITGSPLCSTAYLRTSYCTVDEFAPSCTFWLYECPPASTSQTPPPSGSTSGITASCGANSDCVEDTSYDPCTVPYTGPYDCASTGWLTDNITNGTGSAISGPGIYNLCYTLQVDSVTPNYYGAAPVASCYWTYNGVVSPGFGSFVSSPSSPASNITNTIIANQLYGGSGGDGNVPLGPDYVPIFKTSSPIYINATFGYGSDWFYTFNFTPITCSGCNNGTYATTVQNPTNVFVELGSPYAPSGGLFGTQFCVNPVRLPSCPIVGGTYTPQTANIPCLLYNWTINLFSPVSYEGEFSTAMLVPNDYELCAYEGTKYNASWGINAQLNTNYNISDFNYIVASNSSESMFWNYSFFSVANCNTNIFNPFCTQGLGGGTLGLNSIQAAACNLYLYVSEALFILALIIMLTGAIVYAGASLLPGQTRGQVQGYGMGLVLAGAASAVITAVSVYVLTSATGYSLQDIFLVNQCGTSTFTTVTIPTNTVFPPPAPTVPDLVFIPNPVPAGSATTGVVTCFPSTDNCEISASFFGTPLCSGTGTCSVSVTPSSIGNFVYWGLDTTNQTANQVTLGTTPPAPTISFNPNPVYTYHSTTVSAAPASIEPGDSVEIVNSTETLCGPTVGGCSASITWSKSGSYIYTAWDTTNVMSASGTLIVLTTPPPSIKVNPSSIYLYSSSTVTCTLTGGAAGDTCAITGPSTPSSGASTVTLCSGVGGCSSSTGSATDINSYQYTATDTTTGVTANAMLSVVPRCQDIITSDTTFTSQSQIPPSTCDITINSGVTVTTDGVSFVTAGTFTNDGTIITGDSLAGGAQVTICGCGCGCSPFPASNVGTGQSSSYGAAGGGGAGDWNPFTQSNTCTNGNTYPDDEHQGGAGGGSTTSSAGSAGSGCSNGAVSSCSNPTSGGASSPPTGSTLLADLPGWFSSGISTYLEGAGGGSGGDGCGNGSAQQGESGGDGTYGIYIQAQTIYPGTIEANGQDGSNGGYGCGDGTSEALSGAGGGGGGGVVVLAYNYTAPSTSGINVAGGAGGSGAYTSSCGNGDYSPGVSGAAGGSGYIDSVNFGNSPPVTP